MVVGAVYHQQLIQVIIVEYHKSVFHCSSLYHISGYKITNGLQQPQHRLKNGVQRFGQSTTLINNKAKIIIIAIINMRIITVIIIIIIIIINVIFRITVYSAVVDTSIITTTSLI